MQIVPGDEDELGYVDSIFGRGTWTRVTDGVFKYVNGKLTRLPLTRFSFFSLGFIIYEIVTHLRFAGGLRTG